VIADPTAVAVALDPVAPARWAAPAPIPGAPTTGSRPATSSRWPPGRVTAWDPPRRFAYGSMEGDPGDLAYEFLVEARTGDTCVVRLIASGFGTGAEYDGQTAGWKLFLSNLRLYLTHFPGQHGGTVIVNGFGKGANAEVWHALASALGLPTSAAKGERVSAFAADAPPLGGVVERVTDGMLTLLLATPAPGASSRLRVTASTCPPASISTCSATGPRRRPPVTSGNGRPGCRPTSPRPRRPPPRKPPASVLSG